MRDSVSRCLSNLSYFDSFCTVGVLRPQIIARSTMFKVRGPVGKTFLGFRDVVMAAPMNYMKIGLYDCSFYVKDIINTCL